jgi:DtxR family transcriptional regulator, Mn-dependent transcriptional regulator
MGTQKQLSSQMEDYLESIYHLCEEQGVARVKSIANRLLVSYPSVVGAIKNLKGRQLVHQEHYGYVRLTDEGQKIAGAVIYRHEVLTRFLMGILGLDLETASNDACKIEHSVSPETVKRLGAVAEFIENESRINLDWKKEFKRFYKTYESRKPI